MSFSFNARGKTVALALAAVAVELDKVVAAQPIHAPDAEAVKATAEAYAALLPEDETRDVIISCNGWVEYHGSGEAPEFLGASVGVSARLITRE